MYFNTVGVVVACLVVAIGAVCPEDLLREERRCGVVMMRFRSALTQNNAAEMREVCPQMHGALDCVRNVRMCSWNRNMGHRMPVDYYQQQKARLDELCSAYTGDGAEGTSQSIDTPDVVECTKRVMNCVKDRNPVVPDDTVDLSIACPAAFEILDCVNNVVEDCSPVLAANLTYHTSIRVREMCSAYIPAQSNPTSDRPGVIECTQQITNCVSERQPNVPVDTVDLSTACSFSLDILDCVNNVMEHCASVLPADMTYEMEQTNIRVTEMCRAYRPAQSNPTSGSPMSVEGCHRQMDRCSRLMSQVDFEASPRFSCQPAMIAMSCYRRVLGQCSHAVPEEFYSRFRQKSQRLNITCSQYTNEIPH